MSEVLGALAKIIDNYLGYKCICTSETTFLDLELDSLDTFDLMSQIEEKYGIVFDEDFIVTSLGELVMEIEKKI